jgi:hypothetical protein
MPRWLYFNAITNYTSQVEFPDLIDETLAVFASPLLVAGVESDLIFPRCANGLGVGIGMRRFLDLRGWLSGAGPLPHAITTNRANDAMPTRIDCTAEMAR